MTISFTRKLILKMQSNLNIVLIHLLYILNNKQLSQLLLCEDDRDYTLTLVICPLWILHERAVY